MQRRASRLLPKLVLLVLFLPLSLLLAEGVVRLFGPAPPRIVEVPRDDDAELRRQAENEVGFRLHRWGDSSRHVFVETPAGRRLRANASIRIRHFLNGREIDFRTNSLGYRNRELSPPSIFRVLFLGDSITGGDYLEESETFVRQLEQLSWQAGRPIEAINAGLGAVGLMTELAILEESGLATRPDAVVLGFYLNDFNESFGFDAGGLPDWLERSHLVWLLVQSLHILDLELRVEPSEGGIPVRTLRREIGSRFPPGSGDPLVARDAFHREILDSAMDWGGAWSEENWRAMQPLFARFRRLADEHGFAPLIVVFPVALQARAGFLEDTPQRRLREIGRSLSIPVLDVLPLLRAHPDPGSLFYDHCHHTPEGNRLIAEALRSFLEEHLAIPRAPVPPALRNAAAS